MSSAIPFKDPSFKLRFELLHGTTQEETNFGFKKKTVKLSADSVAALKEGIHTHLSEAKTITKDTKVVFLTEGVVLDIHFPDTMMYKLGSAVMMKRHGDRAVLANKTFKISYKILGGCVVVQKVKLKNEGAYDYYFGGK